MNIVKKRILVVDDELIIRKLVGEFLEKKGFEVECAMDGVEALELADKKVFDLILSDLHMPKMEGDVLIKSIKNKPEYKHTPFLFLSGDSNKETWLKNLNSGADDFILKPFDPEILYSKIKANINKFDLRKEIIKSNEKKNLTQESGSVLFISDSSLENLITPEKVASDIIFANQNSNISNLLEANNIWLIVIDESADWAFSQIQKIREVFTNSHSITLLISPNQNQERLKKYFQLGLNNFIIKIPENGFIESQINSKINRENLIKNKYFNTIKMAANNSFMHMDYVSEVLMSNFNFNIIHQPFESIPGGDFYEIFNVKDEGKIIVIGDVMGKKWDAWFFVSSYISYIRSLIKLLTYQHFTDVIHHPSLILENLNKFIYKDAQLSEIFTTLSVIYLDDKNAIMRISSAGAQKPMMYDGNEVKTLNIIGTLMGIIENVKYEELELEFGPHDKLLLFTDGYNESSNSLTGKMLDNDEVELSFKSMIGKENLTAKDIENHMVINNHIKKFDDDRTMLLINGHKKT